MAKFIFVTGGVLSGLGKGITAASVGNILQAKGLKVWMQKFDQYLNVDAGTLNPNEHGECFVLDDGAETDLDLGHYERFLNISLDKTSSVMSGQIYQAVLEKERQGKYLGKTIQMIPHVTDEVKSRIYLAAKKSRCDVLITEIGGTIGDYEGTHFVEAIRQMQYEVGRENVLYVHVGFLPYLGASEELKSKPIQNSVHDLQAFGIHPDVLICRADHPVNSRIIEKIALFTGVENQAVIPLETVDSVYKVPMIFQKAKLDEFIGKKLKIKFKKNNFRRWREFIKKIETKKDKEVKIALVGKYMGMKDTYFSVTEAIKIAGWHQNTKINIIWIDAEQIEKEGTKKLFQNIDGIIVPGGFGSRGIEGKIETIKYARENKIPFLGLCYGLQLATIEFARNVCQMKNANTTEIDPKTPYPVVYIMPEQEKLIEGSDYGGTMRLGAYPCILKESSLAERAYRKSKIENSDLNSRFSNLDFQISERHRHRYEVNNKYRNILEKNGLVISGTSPNNKLVEIIELPSTSLGTGKNHPFFVATQFHPELKSRPLDPHPLFMELVKTAIK